MQITYPILTLAILASNCRWAGANASYKQFELEHFFLTAEVRYVVTRAETVAVVEAAIAATGLPIEIIIFSDLLQKTASICETSSGSAAPSTDPTSLLAAGQPTPNPYRNLHDLLTSNTANRLAISLQLIKTSSIAALMTTSGTTGRPKMAARTHSSMIHEALANEDNHAQKPYPVRRLACTPIFHAFSSPEMIVNALRRGHPMWILPRFGDAARFAGAVATFGITETFAPPPLLLSLLHEPACHAQLQTLRAVYTGGAPLSAALSADFRALFPATQPVRIVQVWGMTEGGWFTSQKYPHDADASGAVGTPLPGVEVRVVIDPLPLPLPLPLTSSVATTTATAAEAPDLLPLHVPLIGELQIRAPQLMSRYHGDAAATAAAFTHDGWLRTGDIGYQRPRDGAVVLVDRAKDLIKVNGFQVSPSELEDALLLHPAVRDVGVVGVRCAELRLLRNDGGGDGGGGGGGEGGDDPVAEQPVAFVVVRSPRADAAEEETNDQELLPSPPPPTAADLLAWLSTRLARYKVAKCEVRFVESIPKSAAGKILRMELRKMALSGDATPP